MKNLTCASLIGLSCAAVALTGLVGTTMSTDNPMHSAAGMETGVTSTQSAPSADVVRPPMMSAAPQITGPAPLPSEEQGLPG